MKRTAGLKAKVIDPFFALVLLFGVALPGCAPYVGRNVDVPEVPSAPALKGDARTRLATTMALGEFKDMRDPMLENSNYTEPSGNIGAAVRAAIEKSFSDRGVVFTGGAPLLLTGEIRQWRS